MPSKKPRIGRPRADGVRPRWDGDAQELWVGEVMIHKFKRPATRQGPVLDEFQRRRWDHFVDNPFLRHGAGAKDRLHDAIKLLNRSQKMIRFRGSGDGLGVTWEWR